MKHHLLAAIALTALSSSAFADLTINLDAELLKSGDGAPMPLSGLLLLTAHTSPGLFGPSASSFTSANEIVLAKWDLSGGFGEPGAFQGSASGLLLGNGWDEGDPLRLYWYPSLTLSSLDPGAGTLYGSYTDPSGLDGSAPWITGANGSTTSLRFFTQDAAFLSAGGSNPAAAGLALLQVPGASLSNAVVPEGDATLVLSIFCLGLAVMCRWRVPAGEARL